MNGGRIEWTELSEFSNRNFRILRVRYGIHYRTIFMLSRPRVPVEEIRRWERGKAGSVSDEFRRNMYEALRQAMIEACLRVARLLQEHKERDVAVGKPKPVPAPSSFVMGDRR